jgi:DNA-binding MarR family transcriptional regulator
MSGEPARDPISNPLWRSMRLLPGRMDRDIQRIYDDEKLDVKPNFVMELLRLDTGGPMTIAELAASVERTHSAMSQKVAAMQRAGLVRTAAGHDGRSKYVLLTRKAKRVVGRLAAEWRATEAAIDEIDSEIPYPLSTVVTDVELALERTSFYDRVKRKLAEDPAWRE